MGLVFFFLLDKAELWHHGHEHGQGHHGIHDQEDDHSHDHPSQEGLTGSWAVLTGDSVHAFGDGVLVAAAFMTNFSLGVAASVAVLTHEIPHHMGDLAVLQRGLGQGRQALFKLCMAGGVTVVGGLAGFFLIKGHETWLPFLLVVASSSGRMLRLAVNETNLPLMGRTAQGPMLMRLLPGESVAGVACVEPNASVLVASRLGQLKRLALESLRSCQRGDIGRVAPECARGARQGDVQFIALAAGYRQGRVDLHAGTGVL
jgi:zinc transporter ZupT